MYFSYKASDSPLSLINNLLVIRIPYVLLQMFCLDNSSNIQSYQHIKQLDQYCEDYPHLHKTPDLELHPFTHTIKKKNEVNIYVAQL